MSQDVFWIELQEEIINNEYHLKQFLGCGGYGAVYKAYQVIKDQRMREVAVKLIAPEDDETKAEKQLIELKAAFNLNHEHLIHSYTGGSCKVQGDEYLFIVMEIAETNLEKKLKTEKISIPEVKEIVKATATALQYLHNSAPRKAHRDIKPANLLYVIDKEAKEVKKWKVSDFGSLREIGTKNSARTSDRRGTTSYLSPEAFDGILEIHCDMWSLGIMTAEILTGTRPFMADTEAQLMKKIIEEKPEIDWSKIPEPFTAIVRGCLEKQREKRWTAEQVLTALKPKVQSQSSVISSLKVNKEITKSTLIPPETTPPPEIAPPAVQPSSIAPAPRISSPTPQSVPQSVAQRLSTTPPQQLTPRILVPQPVAPVVKAPKQQRQPEYISEDIGCGVTLEMASIPGGIFAMGSPSTEEGREEHETPQHQVTIPAFYAGKYLITQAQWQAVIGNNNLWKEVMGNIPSKPSYFKGEKRPIENISWHMAVEFCNKLSKKTGKKYRLLSEAEWEYACRAGTKAPFHFGKTITPELVNYNGNKSYANAPKGLYREQTTDVGSFPPNAFGLYDMHGNLLEWCSDKWHDNYKGAPTDGSSWETGFSNRRVLRGGSWNNSAVLCRSALRYSYPAGDRNYYFGFRVALVSVWGLLFTPRRWS